MRILIAVHTYYPDNNGVQMVTQYMAEGLAKNHEVLVITQKKRGYEAPEYESGRMHNGVRIERIEIGKGGRCSGAGRKTYIARIESYHPDILMCVCTQSWPYDWVCRKLDQLPGRKILYTHGYSGLLKKYPLAKDLLTLRGRAFLYHFHWWRYYRTAYRYIAGFDLVTYLSENNISYWYAKEHGLQNGAVLGNAVEDIFFKDSILERRDAERGGRKIQFVYIANYDSNKNQKMVLTAFYEAGLSDARLVMVGSRKNQYYQELDALRLNLAAQKGEKDVSLLNGLPRERIPHILGESDVFVCGSRKEEYPIMLCEAAAKGLPVISTDVGHASGMDGIIIVHSIEEMTQAMQTLYHDRQERSARGKKLREYAIENYTIQEKVAWMETKLKELCGV